MTVGLVLLSCACVLWCCLHSLLIFRPVSLWLKGLLGRYAAIYRLLYNGFSLITLLPLIFFIHTHPGGILFGWKDHSILRLMVLLAALCCFYGGGRHYDFKYFIGLRQMRSGADVILLSGGQGFTRQGILGVVRHPWYLGSLLFIWSILPVYSHAASLAGAVFSLYLVVGAFIEERRLCTEFGAAYRRYQQEVSMFFPWKWLKTKISGGTGGTH